MSELGISTGMLEAAHYHSWRTRTVYLVHWIGDEVGRPLCQTRTDGSPSASKARVIPLAELELRENFRLALCGPCENRGGPLP